MNGLTIGFPKVKNKSMLWSPNLLVVFFSFILLHPFWVTAQSIDATQLAQILVKNDSTWKHLTYAGIVTLQTNSDILEIPVTPDLAPNVYLSLHVVKGVDESNPFADVRIGIVELVVSPEQFELDILVTPQRDLYQPGETAVYDILVTDYQGNPVQTSLALSLVDLAVLSLKQDNAPQIMDGFYYRQPIRSQTGSGLIISGEGLEIEIPVEQLGLGGGGGGLEAAEAERALDSEGEDVRSDFRDTAFWRVFNYGFPSHHCIYDK